MLLFVKIASLKIFQNTIVHTQKPFVPFSMCLKLTLLFTTQQFAGGRQFNSKHYLQSWKRLVPCKNLSHCSTIFLSCRKISLANFISEFELQYLFNILQFIFRSQKNNQKSRHPFFLLNDSVLHVKSLYKTLHIENFRYKVFSFNLILFISSKHKKVPWNVTRNLNYLHFKCV